MSKTVEYRRATVRAASGWRAVAIAAIIAVLAATLVVIAPVVSATAANPTASSSCGATVNAIVCENQKPGTDPKVWDIDGAGDPSIQGFATDISVNVGQRIDFKVDTDASAYKIDIYRTGWYQGLGARYIQSVPVTATLPQKQPQCISDVTTELYDCGTWNVSASWNVPADAVSGVYIAKLTRNDNGGSSHIIFIVRNDGNHSDVLFQTSDPTWNAYNTYGGSDFYQGGANGRAYKISYNRPFATRGAQNGRDFYFASEYATVRFLERNGYDTSYIAGVDTDRRGGELLNHNVFLSVGHDEYWSAGQRANILAARDAGVNEQFLSGNEAYWHTRYEPSADGSNTAYRTLVSYKETWSNKKIDPTPEWTGTWRDPRFAGADAGGTLPENAVTGTMYMSNSDDLPLTVTSDEGKTRLWRNTSLTSLAAGSSAALADHTVGYESDEDVDNGFRPAGLIRLSTTVGSTPQYLTDYGSVVVPGTTEHHVTLYKAASGALVFGAGTIQWGWGLDQEHDGDGAPADSRMQQAQVNLLADMGAQPSTLMAGLVRSSKSTDTTPPTTTITSPAAGASVPAGSSITVSGTASDVGGRVAGVEVSLDGGTSWHPATGTTSWSYTGIQSGSGAATIKARAIDDSANFSAAGVSVSVTVTGSSTVFGSASPVTASADDTTATELGLQITPDSDGVATGVRFFKGTKNTGTHVGSLWNSATGQRLATVTFTGETATGWQTASFATPVSLLAGTKYTVSYTAPSGGYAADPRYWPYTQRTSSPLTVQPGVGQNAPGVYGAPGTMPTSTYGETNYWVDLVFDKAASTPLRIVGTSPLASSSSNPTTAAVTVTLSRPAVESSVSMVVADTNGTAAAGSVAYDATAKKITFTPSAALQSGMKYTVTVGAKDTDGVGIASDASTWTFTTAQATLPEGTCPCTLFTDDSTPTVAAAADNASVTVGTRFTTSEAGKITGLRFYKGASNLGTHTGTLWGADGSALASVTFTNESSAGWQTAVFSTPVSVVPGVEYIASYTAPAGNYSVTPSQLASAVTRGPLTAVANGGSYTYAGGFPKERSTSGYAVDAIFERPIPAPVLVTRTPDDGAVNVAADATISATFDAPLAANTAIAVTAGGAPVGGRSTLSADGKTVTFTPSAALPAGTLIGVAIPAVTGANGGKTGDVAWSYTTLYASGDQISTMFSGLPTGAGNASDHESIVLGMRFTPTVAGEVRAIRFYKSAANTGTHTGYLWGSGSDPLATVTFSNESAVGWQRAELSTPVQLVAGQTYTVSYVAPTGNYTYQSGAFAAGLSNGPLTAPAAGNGAYLYAASGRPTQSYNATNYFVDVEFVASPDSHQTLFGYATPSVEAASDGDAVELGTAFTVARDAAVTAIRFYKGAGNTGTHVGTLWAADGTKLASVTFTGESDSGWQRAALSNPVQISANTTYVVSYYAPVGHYPITQSYFTSPQTSGDITGISDQNGRFHYGVGGGFPTDSFGSSAYFVDAEVVFPATSQPTPVLTSATPAAGATVDAASTSTISANLTSARAATIAVTQGGASVAGTSTYSPATGVVAFAPASPLAAGAAYSVTVTANGSPVAGGSWTFSTKPPTVTSVTPDRGATNVDPQSVSLKAVLSGAQSADIAVTVGGQPFPGTTAFDASTGTATFTPQSGWDWGQTYSATVTSNAATLQNGSWSFTTIKRATVTAATPASGSSVSPVITTKLTATLADALSASIAVTSSGVAVPGTSAYDAGTKTVTFTPTSPLGWDTPYDVVVSANGTQAINGAYSFRTTPKVFAVNSAVWNGGNDVAPGNGICADSAGRCTLRAALAEANALGGDAKVTVAGGFAGGTITVPDCTTSQYMTTSGVPVIGGGAFFTVTAPNITIDLQNKLSISSPDCGATTALYINGAKTTVTNVSGFWSGNASYVLGAGASGSTLSKLTQVQTANYNTENVVVVANGANDITVRESTFSGAWSSGVLVGANATVSNLQVLSNTFTNDQSTTACSTTNARGCRYDAITAGANATVTKPTIQGNTFSNFDSASKTPIDFGAVTIAAMSDLTITGNTFTNIRNATALGGATISLPINRTLGGTNVITANTFTGVKGSAAYAIYWDGVATGTTPSHLSITGNAFDGYGTAGAPSVRMFQTGSVTFEKNTFGSNSTADLSAISEYTAGSTLFNNYDTSSNRKISPWYPTTVVDAGVCTVALTLNPGTGTTAALPARVDVYWSPETSSGAEKLVMSQNVTSNTAQTITLPYSASLVGRYRLQTIGAAPVSGGQAEASQFSRAATVSATTCRPAITVNQAVGQSDPAYNRDVHYTVTSSVPLATSGAGALVATDFSTSGSSAINTRVISVTPTSDRTYDVLVRADSIGVYRLSLPAGTVADAQTGATNSASTSTDNSVLVLR